MKEKRFKSINEVSKLLSLHSHVIRYWDSKFDGLSTRLSTNGQRFFNKDNINNIKKLKLTLSNNEKRNHPMILKKKIIKNRKNKLSYELQHLSKNQKIKDSYFNDLKNIRDNLRDLLDL